MALRRFKRVNSVYAYGTEITEEGAYAFLRACPTVRTFSPFSLPSDTQR